MATPENQHSGPKAWAIRHGENGEYESTALAEGIALIGFRQVSSLAAADNGDKVKELVREAYPDSSARSNGSRSGQLHRFRNHIRTGDVIALKLKTSPGFAAIGSVTSEYEYRDIEGEPRHTLGVDWISDAIPVSDIPGDLLRRLHGFGTILEMRVEDAARRLMEVAAGRPDPVPAPREAVESAGARYSPGPVDPDDQVLDRIHERFPAHRLEALVAAVLEAEGFRTVQSPKGADGGVDVLAGKGPFGLDHPRICVQVKAAAGRTDVKVVRELDSAIRRFGADQGLLVGWGGFTKPAEDEARNQFFRIRLWNARDLLAAVYRHYPNLPQSIRADLPLKQIWVLDENAED